MGMQELQPNRRYNWPTMRLNCLAVGVAVMSIFMLRGLQFIWLRANSLFFPLRPDYYQRRRRKDDGKPLGGLVQFELLVTLSLTSRWY